MGQWNHIDCSQPSPDSPDYHRWRIRQALILNGDICEDDPPEVQVSFIERYLSGKLFERTDKTKWTKIKWKGE